MKQQVERFVGKELRGQRQGAIRKPQAIQDHPRDSFSWRNHFLSLRPQARINHVDKAEVFDDLSYDP
jgi:hypothetical protein